MLVSELRTTITALKDLVVEAGTKSATVKGIDDFLTLLAHHEGEEVADLIAELEALAAATGVKANDVAVRKHLNALNASDGCRTAFEQAFAALNADKSVGTAEADLIFRQYHGREMWRKIYGDRPRWAKRSDALAAIKTSFIERLTQAQKDEQVDKATPW